MTAPSGDPGALPGAHPGAHPDHGGPAPARLGDLWPWLLAPPLLVAGAVLWLWLAAEGGFEQAGRYTIR